MASTASLLQAACQVHYVCRAGDGQQALCQTLLGPGPKSLLPFAFYSAGHVPTWQSWSHLFMALWP